MPVLTIEGRCSGGCGGAVTYEVNMDHGSPDVFPINATFAYAGGHLCGECANAVEAALVKRRLRKPASGHGPGNG
jgi:hypothetical protein